MKVISKLQRLIFPTLHPVASLNAELLKEINLQYRTRKLSELEQSHRWQKRWKAKIYKNLKKVSYSSLLGLVAMSSCGLTLIFHLENKVWILISCLALLVVVLLHSILHFLFLRWVLQEFEMSWQELLTQLALLNIRRMDGRGTNIADAILRITGAIDYHMLQGCHTRRLRNYLALYILPTFITADSDFRNALVLFPWTGSFADIWSANSIGTLCLLLFLFITVYHFFASGVHIIRLERVKARLNLGL